MKIFNKEFTEEIKDVDLNSGYLIGGKVKFSGTDIVDILPGGNRTVVGRTTNVEDDVFVFIPYTDEELIENLRSRREDECFTFINRGTLWYETLTANQKEEMKQWYNAWLDVTETKIVPLKPNWLR